MIPLQVTLEGFLSYKEKQVINFDGSSLWVLCGPNGVGKSAVFDAITFALFNSHRANRGTRGTPKDLINHRADKLIVTFDFIVDGVIYRIKRIHPRKGRSTREAFVVNSADTGNLDNAQTKRIDDTDSEDGFNGWVRQIIGMDYAAFTSSSLLLQGKSEQLLEADPRNRYAILAELIDLSRYQKLCEAAESRRGKFKASVESLEQQLLSPAVRAISDDEMDGTRQLLERTERAWKDAQDAVGRFTGYLEQARHWEVDSAELQKKREELQNARALLERDAEITDCFSEFRELHNVLPALSQIVKGRGSLLKLRAHLNDLQRHHSQLEEAVCAAERKRNIQKQRVTDFEQIIAQLREESTQYLLRLFELGPVVGKLEHIEQLQTEIAKLEEQLATLQPDIAQHLDQAEQQLRILEEKEHTLPWLKTFAREREEFAAVVKSEQEVNTRIVALSERHQEMQYSRTILQSICTGAQEAEKRLYGEMQGSNERLQDAQTRLQQFEGIATKPVCDLCGQEITGEHARQEKARLQQKVDECERDVTKVTQEHQDALRLKQTKEQELTALDAHLEEVKNSYGQSTYERQTALDQAEQHSRRLREAYNAIAEAFQRRILDAVPEENMTWITTVYPKQDDIDEIQQEVKEKATQARAVTQLRADNSTWQALDGQRAVFDLQITEQVQVLNIHVARNARAEKNDVEQRQNTLVAEIGRQQQMLLQAKETSEETDNAFQELDAELQQYQSDIRAETARREEMERSLQTQGENLPEQWQICANSLDEDGLTALELRRADLSVYSSLHEQLAEVRQRVYLYEQGIAVLDAQIAAYPTEAKRPAKEVEEELTGKKTLQRQVGDERDRLRSVLTRLEEQRQRRLELEQRKLEAEKFHHLYSVLAKHLGRSGLQLYLLSQAESAIVDFANQTLGGLSHGRMRLELRHESEPQAQAEKALDLVVHDRNTGERAVPIALVSGSQKFRIAVSLALAIGRYTNREARRIESVIIDEGFGSLDKTGRDDMIQELSTLGQQLSRIILVSHQEEFAYAFSNRYSFKLVDGSSRVTLMDEE